MFPLLAAITAAGGAIANGISARQEANNLAKDVQKQRTQIERSANNLSALEGGFGSASEQAYRWAATMIAKNTKRPEALTSISEILRGSLTQNSQNSIAVRTAVQQMLAGRPIVPTTKNVWLTGALKGALSGFGLGAEFDPAFSTGVSQSLKPGSPKGGSGVRRGY